MYKQSSKYYRSDYLPCKPLLWQDEGICLLYDKRIHKFVAMRYYPKGERTRIKGRYILFTRPVNWEYLVITLGSPRVSSSLEVFLLQLLSDDFIEVV